MNSTIRLALRGVLAVMRANEQCIAELAFCIRAGDPKYYSRLRESNKLLATCRRSLAELLDAMIDDEGLT